MGYSTQAIQLYDVGLTRGIPIARIWVLPGSADIMLTGVTQTPYEEAISAAERGAIPAVTGWGEVTFGPDATGRDSIASMALTCLNLELPIHTAPAVPTPVVRGKLSDYLAMLSYDNDTIPPGQIAVYYWSPYVGITQEPFRWYIFRGLITDFEVMDDARQVVIRCTEDRRWDRDAPYQLNKKLAPHMPPEVSGLTYPLAYGTFGLLDHVDWANPHSAPYVNGPFMVASFAGLHGAFFPAGLNLMPAHVYARREDMLAGANVHTAFLYCHHFNGAALGPVYRFEALFLEDGGTFAFTQLERITALPTSGIIKLVALPYGTDLLATGMVDLASANIVELGSAYRCSAVILPQNEAQQNTSGFWNNVGNHGGGSTPFANAEHIKTRHRMTDGDRRTFFHDGIATTAIRRMIWEMQASPELGSINQLTAVVLGRIRSGTGTITLKTALDYGSYTPTVWVFVSGQQWKTDLDDLMPSPAPKPSGVTDNGQTMTENANQAALLNGEWYWDSAAHQVYVRTFDGTDPSTHTMGVGYTLSSADFVVDTAAIVPGGSSGYFCARMDVTGVLALNANYERWSFTRDGDSGKGMLATLHWTKAGTVLPDFQIFQWCLVPQFTPTRRFLGRKVIQHSVSEIQHDVAGRAWKGTRNETWLKKIYGDRERQHLRDGFVAGMGIAPYSFGGYAGDVAWPGAASSTVCIQNPAEIVRNAIHYYGGGTRSDNPPSWPNFSNAEFERGSGNGRDWALAEDSLDLAVQEAVSSPTESWKIAAAFPVWDGVASLVRAIVANTPGLRVWRDAEASNVDEAGGQERRGALCCSFPRPANVDGPPLYRRPVSLRRDCLDVRVALTPLDTIINDLTLLYGYSLGTGSYVRTLKWNDTIKETGWPVNTLSSGSTETEAGDAMAGDPSFTQMLADSVGFYQKKGATIELPFVHRYHEALAIRNYIFRWRCYQRVKLGLVVKATIGDLKAGDVFQLDPEADDFMGCKYLLAQIPNGFATWAGRTFYVERVTYRPGPAGEFAAMVQAISNERFDP